MVFTKLFKKISGEKIESDAVVDEAPKKTLNESPNMPKDEANSDNEQMNESMEIALVSPVKEFEVKEKPRRDPTEGVNLAKGVALDDLDGYEGDWEPEAKPTTSRKLKKKNVINPGALKAIGAITNFNEKENNINDPLMNMGSVNTSKEKPVIQSPSEIELFIQKVMQRTKKVMSFKDLLEEDEQLYGKPRANYSGEETENQVTAAEAVVEVDCVIVEPSNLQPSTSTMTHDCSMEKHEPSSAPKPEIINRKVSNSEKIEMKDLNGSKDVDEVTVSETSVEVRCCLIEPSEMQPCTSSLTQEMSSKHIDPFWGPKAEIIKRRVSESEQIEMKDFNVNKDNKAPANNENRDFHEASIGPGIGWSYGSSSQSSLCIEFPPIYPPGPMLSEHPLIMDGWSNIPGCPCRVVFDHRINSLFGEQIKTPRAIETYAEANAVHTQPESTSEEQELERLQVEAYLSIMNEVEQPVTETSDVQTDPVHEEPETSEVQEVTAVNVTSNENFERIQRAKTCLNAVLPSLWDIGCYRGDTFLYSKVRSALDELNFITELTGSSQLLVTGGPVSTSSDATNDADNSDPETEPESGASGDEGDDSSVEEFVNDDENDLEEPENQENVRYRIRPAEINRTYVMILQRIFNERRAEEAVLPLPFDFEGYFEDENEAVESEPEESEAEEDGSDNDGNESPEYSEYSPANTDDENEIIEPRIIPIRPRYDLFSATSRPDSFLRNMPAVADSDEDFDPTHGYYSYRPLEFEGNMRKIEQENVVIFNQWAENGIPVETLKAKFICKLCTVDQMHFMCETCQQSMCISCEAKIIEHTAFGTQPQCPFCRKEPTSGQFTCIRLPRL